MKILELRCLNYTKLVQAFKICFANLTFISTKCIFAIKIQKSKNEMDYEVLKWANSHNLNLNLWKGNLLYNEYIHKKRKNAKSFK